MPSPSPSNNSTNSSTSLVSHEGRKGSSSAQPKFGAESPQAVRKLMALAEPGKARPRKLTSSVSSKSSLQSNTSPVTSPAMNTRRRAAAVAAAAAAVQQQHSGSGHHGRSKSEIAVPVSLSAESSSVSAAPSQPARKGSANITTSATDKVMKGQGQPNRVSRTVSRSDEDQVSAV